MWMGVMLVTGAARGIGAAIALEAARKGWDVAVHYAHSGARAERIAEDVRHLGHRAVTIKADLQDPLAIESLYHELDGKLGTIDALINNAATDCIADFINLSLGEIDRVLKVNVVSVVRCCQEAIRRMGLQYGGRGGSIVNISSISARTGGMPRDVIYTLTKGALDALTIGLSNEVAGDGIRVCAVRPGMIATELLEAAIGKDALMERARQTYPMRRPGRPDEVAKLAVWLASSDASFISGRTYDIAGGA
jgi:NAD(P)-dependent dehydrogenase (short-subunit alcohol dehydrogenase family)